MSFLRSRLHPKRSLYVKVLRTRFVLFTLARAETPRGKAPGGKGASSKATPAGKGKGQTKSVAETPRRTLTATEAAYQDPQGEPHGDQRQGGNAKGRDHASSACEQWGVPRETSRTLSL